MTTPTIEKPCPDCGGTLIIRTNRENGSQFIGCMSWPNCDHHEPIPETLRMRLMGAPTLPFIDDDEARP